MEPQAFSREQIIQKIEYFCSYRERCAAEIVQKLKQLQVPDEEVDFYLNHLQENNFWNEKRFTTAFVRGKFSIKNWGKQKIVQQLYAKKIDAKIIQECIRQIEEEFYLQKLEDVLTKKNKTIKENDYYIRKRKLQYYAQQKGFELDKINQVLKKMNL